jgi:hypothetical protein
LNVQPIIQLNNFFVNNKSANRGGIIVRRRAQLRRLLQEACQQGAAPTSEALAQALGVSVRTVVSDKACL